MKFISAAPVLFTTTFLVWNATPALSKTIINDKDADIYAESFCMDSPLGWNDNEGEEYDCVWYSVGRRCQKFGEKFTNDGMTANGACCACGGGEYSPITAFTTNYDLNDAVNEYCNDPAEWENNEKFNKYGPIESWNVSKILNMSYLFSGKRTCNPDIGNWNVGKVTSFDGMFSGARSFNQDIGEWDVSSGTSFVNMFSRARSFNQDIGGWNVSSGTRFRNMFNGARSFNQDIGEWNVLSGIDFTDMFNGASNFNKDIGEWNVSNGVQFLGMFDGARSFNRAISGWDVSSGINFTYMFKDASAFNQSLCNWKLSWADLHQFCDGAVYCGDCN